MSAYAEAKSRANAPLPKSRIERWRIRFPSSVATGTVVASGTAGDGS
jgi:hypothetical protein